MHVAAPLDIRAADRRRLARLVRSESDVATRAKIVILASRGLPNTTIARALGVTRPTVTSWRARYESGGVDALETQPRPGRPPRIDDMSVVLATIRDHPAARARWSTRSMGEHLGVSANTVAKVWRRWGLQPSRAGEVTLPVAPALPPRVRDVVGVHLDPPCLAVVVRMSERPPARGSTEPTALMCAERALPVHDHRREHPLDQLLMALENAAGSQADPCFPRCRSTDLVTFLTDVAESYSSDKLRLLLADGATPRSADVRAWLRSNRRVRAHTAVATVEWPALLALVLHLTDAPPHSEVAKAVDNFLAGWRAGTEKLSWTAPHQAAPPA